jgi:hypothetical protein
MQTSLVRTRGASINPMTEGVNAVNEVGNHLVLVVDLVVYAVQLLRYEHLHMALPLRHYRDLTVYIT